MEGDDGRFYATESEWESAYDEGCKAELYAVLAAELGDPEQEDYDDFIGPRLPYANEEIPF